MQFSQERAIFLWKNNLYLISLECNMSISEKKRNICVFSFQALLTQEYSGVLYPGLLQMQQEIHPVPGQHWE